LISALSAIALAIQASFSGVPTKVYDGDTLNIGARSFRLYGIDAPELKEPYGPVSREYLRSLVNGVTVTCQPTGKKSYLRYEARCYLPSGLEINQLMVEAGMALDCRRYSKGIYRQFEPAGVRQKIVNKGYCR